MAGADPAVYRYLRSVRLRAPRRRRAAVRKVLTLCARLRCGLGKRANWRVFAPQAGGYVLSTNSTFVVHDLNPVVFSKKVKGFVQAQSWFQDYTGVWMEK